MSKKNRISIAGKAVVNSGNVRNAIQQLLDAYADDAIQMIQGITKDAADYCISEISKRAPKKTGDYAKSWKVKDKIVKDTGAAYIIGSDDYRLTHLLEYGHQKVLWGNDPKSGSKYVDGKPHIRPAEEAAIKRMTETIERGLNW